MEPGDTQEEQSPPGLLSSLHSMVATVLEIIQTRIEIIANEVEEEREHLRAMILYGLLAVLFLTLGLLLGTLYLVLVFWDEYRVTVVGLFAGLYLIGGIAGLLMIRRRERQRPKMFSTTVAELRQDRENLRSRP